LPQKNALETVLRDGLAADPLDPAGIYFGTRSGKVYSSNNEGKSWELIMEGLPAVVCVKAGVVSDGAAGLPPANRGTKKKGGKKTARRK
jgi:hypothetical protein